jgi:hypothetical protein
MNGGDYIGILDEMTFPETWASSCIREVIETPLNPEYLWPMEGSVNEHKQSFIILPSSVIPYSNGERLFKAIWWIWV